VRGNYCTWNPLDLVSTTLANGNLQASGSSDGGGVSGTIGVSSGKWYWEVTAGSNYDDIGIWPTSSRITGYPGSTSDSYGYFGLTGNKILSASGASYGATFASGDVIGVALDLDAGTLTFYKNGVSQGTAFSSLTGGFRPAVRAGAAASASTATYLNAGQRPFAYTAPSGFKALCTANLPAPVVTKPSTVMDVKLYTGNGSTQNITGLGFSPDFVWIKSRSFAESHRLLDTVRTATKTLYSDLTIAEGTDSTGLTAFNSDGFTLGSSTAYNQSSSTYAAWCWDAGSSTVTNTQGSISSQVRANASAGFSIVSYTGNGAAANIGHGLGVEPHLIIHKFRSATSNWSVYTKATGAGGRLLLNSTAAFSSDGAFPTAPTSSVFYVNSGLNDNGVTIIAYCFAPVAGYSSSAATPATAARMVRLYIPGSGRGG